MLNELRDEIYANAKAHGFYDEPDDKNIMQKLMLTVTELGEAAESLRCDKFAQMKNFLYNRTKSMSPHDERLQFEIYIKDSFEDEIADTIIRLLDLCGYMEINIDTFIRLKMDYNKDRDYRHGKGVCHGSNTGDAG